MTDALPGFTFDQKTGELSRGGKHIALNIVRASLFNMIAYATSPLTFAHIKLRLETPIHPRGLTREVQYMNRSLAKLGMKIETMHGGHHGGKRLVVGDMPKWRPTIPVIDDDPSLLKMP